ncbi:MAG: hypothetical protein FWF03_06940 [Defluviitaleaceae bacterium]|nr:hypothetical protein [Defluviitaleaceae bacterium]
MYEFKPDYESAQRRIDAFWAREEAERPIVTIVYAKPDKKDYARKNHATWEEYWLDIEYRAEATEKDIGNTVYDAEAMPVAFPNMGPEIFSAWAGCPYLYSQTTTWTEPCIFDWETDADKAVVDTNHPLFKILDNYARLLLERGKDKFVVGLTDFHPGGDHIAALRDPERLALDLLEHPDEVKAKLESSYAEYFGVFDYFSKMLTGSGLPVSSWTPITSRKGMYIPSNDFSCMISKQMFDEFFLEGIVRECRHYGNSIYHLDGPGALQHLDSLLSIEELDAVQWVPGAGRSEVLRWLDVYEKVIEGKKGLQISGVRPSDLDVLMERLPAAGVWLCMSEIGNKSESEEIMKKINKWPRKK